MSGEADELTSRAEIERLERLVDGLHCTNGMLRAIIETEPVKWTKVGDSKPRPHARYEVLRRETGPFVATPCYGMHEPWWVPLTCDLYSPGSTAFTMEDEDLWRPWIVAPEGDIGGGAIDLTDSGAIPDTPDPPPSEDDVHAEFRRGGGEKMSPPRDTDTGKETRGRQREG